jgi:hypothetical protein
MDYTKLTKQELIDKLNEQVHLAKAVEEKDKEIVELQKRLNGSVKREEVDAILKKAKEQIEVSNMTLVAYTNYLKQTKVNLDIQIQINEMLEKLGGNK